MMDKKHISLLSGAELAIVSTSRAILPFARIITNKPGMSKAYIQLSSDKTRK